MFSRQFGRSARQLGRRCTLQPSRTSKQRCYSTETKQTSSPLGKAFTWTLFGATFAGIGAVGTFQYLKTWGITLYSDEESLARFKPDDDEAARVEEAIQNHPFVREIRQRTDLTESRPHLKYPAEHRSRSLTAGTLMGPHKVPVAPIAWADDAGREMTVVMYLGRDVCGHPGIVHGGLLATILDEGLARTCIKALPHNIAVTANLVVDYRKPAKADSFIVLKAETTKVEGRKAWVTGRIETLAKPGETPTVLTEASALFISPKYAAMMPKVA